MTFGIIDMHTNSKYWKFDYVISKHIDAVRDFTLHNIPECKTNPAKPYKIAIQCPFCGDSRKRYKLVINLDDGYYKCFRCGRTGSLLGIYNEFGVRNEFINLLSSISNVNQFSLVSLLRTAHVNSKTTNIEKETSNEANEFIQNNGLLPIKKLKTAYDYAMSRTYNNAVEVDSYYADDKYIYVPIVVDDTIVSFMARLYLDVEKCPRYIIHNVVKDSKLIGFYDEVLSNIASNSIYITEGYFDSLAINYAMSNYVSVCTFGKSKILSVIDELNKVLSNNTKIYLTFDSEVKDKNIVKENIKYGKEIIKKFPNLYIVELPDEDPADILRHKGPLELNRIINDRAIAYIKYKIKHTI